MNVRTRFAPSPTGMLHIGGVRTALFSWLFARHFQGQFLLRIEDTDRLRSTREATEVILDGLKWLGLDWDGEEFFQSRRQSEHIAAIEQLLAAGLAYRCYCSKEDLDAMREDQRRRGLKPRYDGRCRQRPDPLQDAPYVIRFRAPDEGETSIHDLVLGDVTFANNELDDLILMRTDGTPTYNLAVVVDDAAMGITHIIRGGDHLNNTPRQLQLYQALGLPIPEFAHIPLIHGPDGAKMSKRHGAVSITEYQQAGYLPDAMLNYLARLGWAHGDEEIFSRSRLIELFDISSVGKAAARFDRQKLEWLNAHYLRSAAAADLEAEIVSRLYERGIHIHSGPDLKKVITCLQERSSDLNDMAAGASLFYQPPSEYNEKAVRKNFKTETWAILDQFLEQAEALTHWNAESIHALLQEVCLAKEIKLGQLAQPIRVLIAGGPVSPPIDTTLSLLGKKESLRRICNGMKQLHQAGTEK
ncbi:MAG: glutamate--tRNA ligase [Mariprofundaceae bacterium]